MYVHYFSGVSTHLSHYYLFTVPLRFIFVLRTCEVIKHQALNQIQSNSLTFRNLASYT